MTERRFSNLIVNEFQIQPGTTDANPNVLHSKTGLLVAGSTENRSTARLVIPGSVKDGDGAHERSRLHGPRVEAMTYPEIADVKFKRENPYVVSIDLRPILNKHHPLWRGELLEVAREQSLAKIVGGFDPTSMAPDDTVTYYQPTTNGVIKERLPWMHSLFEQEIRYLAERLTGDKTMHLGKGNSALNINYTSEGPYEMHTDRNQITALLGLTNVPDSKGGELVVHQGRDERTNRAYGQNFKLRPQAGILYFFNGLEHPHEVTAYFGKEPRGVMPGDYYNDQVPEVDSPWFDKGIGFKVEEKRSQGGLLVAGINAAVLVIPGGVQGGDGAQEGSSLRIPLPREREVAKLISR